jgi:hypothetical protein
VDKEEYSLKNSKLLAGALTLFALLQVGGLCFLGLVRDSFIFISRLPKWQGHRLLPCAKFYSIPQANHERIIL